MARIVVCSLFEGAFVTVAALALPTDGSAFAASRVMAWRICLPALSTALVALAAFFVAMEPQYRRSFFARDTRLAMYRRHWAAWAEGPHGDEDRALNIADGTFLRYVGEPVVVWIEQSWEQWARSPPTWCTEKWRSAVLEHAHLLPGDGAARLAAAMSSIAGSDGDGDGDGGGARAKQAAASGHTPLSAAAQEEKDWDLSSTLVV